MCSSPADAASGCRATDVTVSATHLSVTLADSRVLTIPLAWFPRLEHATAPERADLLLLDDGAGIHWPRLDEDIRVQALLEGKRSLEGAGAFMRWRTARTGDPSA